MLVKILVSNNYYGCNEKGYFIALFFIYEFKMYNIMEKLKENIKKYQIYENKNYMQYEQDKYSIYQNYLYKRALYGLNSLTEEELCKTCSKKKQRITNVYRRAQIILNRFKQKQSWNILIIYFKKLFPKSEITKVFNNYDNIDDTFKNTLTFKDLNISKEQIISIFMSEGILPKNFLSLENAPISLPSLKNESKA